MACSRAQTPAALDAGFGRRLINPPRGISLAGYFNPRPNTGVLDDLQVKALLFRQGEQVAGMITYDLALLSDPLIECIREALQKDGHAFAATLPLAATHTHTGPDVGGIFDFAPRNTEYLRFVARQTAEAVKAALADLAPADLRCGFVAENPFAFNRRFWMKNGRVVTNPGQGNPDIVRPEGPVDREIAVLSVERKGHPVCLVANICNHTDSTSGALVSADWPGHLERAVQELLGRVVPVITLIAPAGNVNHIDVNNPQQRVYGVEEARRFGRGYGEIVMRALKSAAPIQPGRLRLATKRVAIPKRAFTAEQLSAARQLAAKDLSASSGNLTAEDLAKGNEVIDQFFAQQLLAYAAQTPARRHFDVAALKLGKDLAFVFLPGEPFTEIGMAIKSSSPFRQTFVASLANGECGYVPLKECFERGGYEILPVVGGGPKEDTAELLIAEAGKVLRK